jgi:hypothetical protein
MRSPNYAYSDMPLWLLVVLAVVAVVFNLI